MTQSEATNLMYQIAQLNAEQEREFFALIQPALTEEEALAVITGAASLRLMANQELKEEMGRAMYQYFQDTAKDVTFKGIFVNDGSFPYARTIVEGLKTIETRNRNMLRNLVGERVAIIQTGRGPATIIGYATIEEAFFCTREQFDDLRDQHLVPPGSRYDAGITGKWCYRLTDPETCEPYPLPADAIRHGMSWAEWTYTGGEDALDEAAPVYAAFDEDAAAIRAELESEMEDGYRQSLDADLELRLDNLREEYKRWYPDLF